jgi:type II secretory ATPase GspE/PulE/Tfp pilus assembly ATPase PilB-like protein
MQASMTGHLVLSTLHTNDAPSAVSRLIDMGVEPFLTTSSLTLVVGQRLARVPCLKCSEPVEADPKTLELLGLDPDQVDGAGLRSGPGCGFCAQTGYQGRLGLFEVVRVTRKLRELIVARATEVAVKEEAVAGGMRSMRADGLAKALVGRTTLEEVLRVTPPKVLVLDDDHSIAEGLRMIGSERPDLVLVDLDLPGINPTSLLNRLLEAAVLQRRPVLT